MYPIQATEGFSAHRHSGCSSEPQGPDFMLMSFGSVAILNPLNEVAEDWIAENVSPDRTYWGAKAIVIESRYVADIVRGIEDAGLSAGA